MEKEKFEQKILDVLVEAGYCKKEQLTQRVIIRMEKDGFTEVDIKFLIAK